MILVAATAVGVFGYRANDAEMTKWDMFRGIPVDMGGWRIQIESGWQMLAGPGLAAATAGLVVVRLLRPRPTRTELFRQTGFVAACAALALTSRRFLIDGLLVDRMHLHDDWYWMQEWGEAMQEASIGIALAWSALALAGCLRAERGWIDRASRAVAVLWVIAGVASRLDVLIGRTQIY